MQTNPLLQKYLKHVTQASLDILGSAVRGPTGEEALGEPVEEEVDKLIIDAEALLTTVMNIVYPDLLTTFRDW